MTIDTIIVFGATGMQGRQQPKELLENGYKVRVVSRQAELLDDPAFAGAEKVIANYDDPASIDAALKGVNAVFYQAQSMGDVERVNRQTETVRKAAEKAGVELIIVNSSMWAPDEPCGQYNFDGVLSMEETMRAGPIPVIVFRPTLFMSNLHGDWVKGNLRKGLYRYCHKPDLEADWICLEDVAKFMVAALKKPELAGRKIPIGGPQRLKTLEVVDIIGEAMGKKLRFEHVTPRQFGEEFWELWGPSTGLTHDQFVDGFDSFYTMNNEDPRHPFQADVKAALKLLPIKLTDMRTWAARQDWS